MAETQKPAENTQDAKQVKEVSSAANEVKHVLPKDSDSTDSDKQFAEETEFTDTMTGTVVKAYSLAEAMDKIKAENEKENK